MIIDFLIQVKKRLLDLIFPIECLNCGREGVYLCQKCLNSIPLTNRFTCPVCHQISKNGATCRSCRNKTYLDGLIFAVDYKNRLVRKAIIKSKYDFVKKYPKE